MNALTPSDLSKYRKLTNGSSSIKQRRTRGHMDGIRRELVEVLRGIQPATVRQTFYQLVSRGVIAKTEAEYKTTCRLLTEMRRSGKIPFAWLVDNTRWMRKPRTHPSLSAMLADQQDFYRRALWNDQDDYVEIWLEKDALSSVLYGVTGRYDVPLMVTRGYPSISYLHDAALVIAEIQKPTHLYYVGDHDPSGHDITRAVELGIREFAPDAEIHFTRIAVTPRQIEQFNLPTRPTKKSDSRSKGFEGESVEVDALPPAELKRLVRRSITSHIDQDQLSRTHLIERLERETLGRIVANLPVEA